MFQRILLPVDGSALAERALPYALALARGLGSPVHLLHAITLPTAVAFGPPVPAESWQAILDGSWEAAAAYLEQLKARFAAAGVPATGQVAIGEAAAHILDGAGGPVPTLIVMATHGRGGLRRWVLGSVAEKVVRHSQTPVFLVPAFARAEPPVRTILAPLDGSELAASILSAASELARALGSELVLLRAIEAELPDVHRAKCAALDYLENEKRALEKEGLRVRTVVRHGPAAVEILEYAMRHELDVIAMATHGRSALARWALGSVADRVLHAAPVPVLLLRPHTAAGR